MLQFLKKTWACLLLLAIVCFVVPSLLSYNPNGTFLDMQNPYIIYFWFIMPTLAATVCMTHMCITKKPMFFLFLSVEVLVLLHAALILGFPYGFLTRVFFEFVFFLSIPALFVLLMQAVTWGCLKGD